MDNLVVKSNELNETPLYKKSLELKIFSKIITLVRKKPKSDIFTFEIKELMNDFKGSNENYQYIKQTAKNMMVAEFGDGKKNIILEVIFRKVDITEAGIISFKIDSEFKPYVVGLSKNFTKYYFENIARLNSGFSIRLYELLKQWEKVGNKKFNITALKYLLKIPETKYKLFGDFKKRVLITAEKELKEKTDIYFKFEEIKTGRKITDIQFYIFSNIKALEAKKENKLIELKSQKEKTKIDSELKKELINLQIDESFIEDIFERYSEEQIERNLKHTKQELFNEKITSSIGGYFRSALKFDYANQQSLFDTQKEVKKEVLNTKREQQQKEELEAQRLEFEKKEFEKKKTQYIIEYIKNNLDLSLNYYQEFRSKEEKKGAFKIFKFQEIQNTNELINFIEIKTIESGMFRVSLYQNIMEEKIHLKDFLKAKGFKKDIISE
ncbi:MAG: Unknown protein [uncultured Campylobacterales bacterium]|uniref:Initiator Rep protein WH1 domain-containing protein n=1 Tax=uncultured Campylobacterales bacterium TaxID=352960 RepID=A0A6S6T6P5_9BACT|nr:MAG: Unknown protein [uncultured Campylobacterales bacterium]